MTRGGKRKNSGRKPVADKKQQICLYIEQTKIKKLGGVDAIKDKIYKYVDRSKRFSSEDSQIISASLQIREKFVCANPLTTPLELDNEIRKYLAELFNFINCC